MKLTAGHPSDASERQRKHVAMEAAGLPSRRLNVNMPDDLYRKIKLRCAEEGRDISEITRDLWIEYLSK